MKRPASPETPPVRVGTTGSGDHSTPADHPSDQYTPAARRVLRLLAVEAIRCYRECNAVAIRHEYVDAIRSRAERW